MMGERGNGPRIAALAASAVLAVFGGAALYAQAGPTPDAPMSAESEIVVTGMQPGSEITVSGRRVPRCARLADDPLDEVDLPLFADGEARKQSVIVPFGGNGFAFRPDEEQITGPTFWQRAGTGIDQYVFRAPTDGTPMCIGARWSHPSGYAQFRRIVDSGPFKGKRIRFTAWAATREAADVRFWLAAGWKTVKLHNGGNTNNQEWGGNHGWTPIMLEIGPVAERAGHISYGFLLYGHGDVWIHDPKLEIVTDEPAASRTDEIAMIGRDDD